MALDRLVAYDNENLVISAGAPSGTPDSAVINTKTLRAANRGTSTYADFVTCFGPETLLQTEHGEQAVADLTVGSRVWTLDAGLQTITWIGHTVVSGVGASAPVTIEAGALGNARPLIVSQEHRIHFCDDYAELLFGVPEILVSAKHLCALPGVSITPVPTIAYTHIIFDRHHIVCANGIMAESFSVSQTALEGTETSAYADLLSLFASLKPGLNQLGQAVATCLKRHEAQLWCQLRAA